MDIDIVNSILRQCFEQQTCLFEVSPLCTYCLERRLCTDAKHVLASVRNYIEIFKISRDRNRIEFFMPVSKRTVLVRWSTESLCPSSSNYAGRRRSNGPARRTEQSVRISISATITSTPARVVDQPIAPRRIC